MVAASLASHHKKHQAPLQKDLLTDKLKKSNFGRAILQMVELNTRVGSDWTPLFDALDSLKVSLLEKKQTETEDFQSDGIQHENDVVRLGAEIQTYEQQVQEYTEDLDNLVSSGNALKHDLGLQESRLDAAKGESAFEKNYLENLQTRWDNDKNDYGTALEILDQCIELLDQSRGYSGSAFSSFVQTNSKSFKKASKKISKIATLTKLNSESFFIAPIAAVFAELAKGGEELDLVATTQARNAIQELKDHLLAGLEALNGIYTQDTNDHTNVLNNLTNEINTLANQSIPQTTRDIQSNDDAQKEKEEQLSLARQNLSFSRGQLVLENQSWDQRIALNALLLPQYDSEYGVVVQAEAIIKNAANSGQI
jgi:hypothetical protein